MIYIVRKAGWYYFNRRVPVELHEYDSRTLIRFALKTDSRKEAIRLANLQNTALENYWRELVQSGSKHSQTAYEDAVKRARLLGFSYMPALELAEAAYKEIIERLFHVQKEKYGAVHAEAVLGGIEKPKIKLDELFPLYYKYSTEIVLNKSPNQLRKWKRPRERAVENLITVIGKKIITELTRDDLLKFKDWWLHRIHEDNLGPNSANKNFHQLKVMLETVNDNLNLNLEIDHLFRKLPLKEEDSQRLPFTTEHIKTILLNPDNLAGLNPQAKGALYVIAESGVGLSEQVGLLPEEIVVDAKIPHIIIKPRHQNGLKTKYRKRIVPLVGYALETFKAFPNGLTDYVDKPDTLSSVLNKYLRDNKLLPTEHHSVYSLRHSFQDRLLAANAPDRVQADLMGHKFNRQAYGNGASIEQKLEWIMKIQLKL